METTEEMLSDDDRASCALQGLDPANEITAVVPPKKLSDLLEMAVDDAVKLSRRRGFVLNMSTWYRRTGNICNVCMAGSIMANRLKVGLRDHGFGEAYGSMSTYGVGQQWSAMMLIVNDLREGQLSDASIFSAAGLEYPGYNTVSKILDVIDNEYLGALERAPWRVYREVVVKLRKAGF